MKAIAVLLIVLLLAAGCASDREATRPGNEAVRQFPLHTPVGTYVLQTDCSVDGDCYEPTAAFDLDGTLLVTAHAGDTIFLLGLDGQVVRSASPIQGADGLLQTGPDGTVQFTTLFEGGVAWSVRSNGSWQTPLVYRHPGALPNQFIDRQWLAFSFPDIGFLVYSLASRTGAPPNSIWAAPFDDERQFGEPVRLASADERQAIGISGPPAFDTGRLIVPLVAALRPQTSTPVAESALSYTQVWAAVLDAHSQVHRQVIHDAGPDDAIEKIPAMTGGNLATVLWAQKSGGLYTSQLFLGNWSEPRLQNEGRAPATLPWIMEGESGPTMVWYEQTGAGPRNLQVVARHVDRVVVVGQASLGDAPVDALLLQNFPTTDFAYAAREGVRFAIPWYDRDSGLQVAVLDTATLGYST